MNSGHKFFLFDMSQFSLTMMQVHAQYYVQKPSIVFIQVKTNMPTCQFLTADAINACYTFVSVIEQKLDAGDIDTRNIKFFDVAKFFLRFINPQNCLTWGAENPAYCCAI